MRRSFVLTICMVGLAASPTLAGVIRHDRTDAWHQTLAAEPQFDGVGFLLNQATGGAGSATLLSSEWVLTAAHVVDVLTLGGNSGFFFDLGGPRTNIAEMYTHPNWNSGDITKGWDIGLVRLAEPLTGLNYAEIFSGPAPLGMEGTLVGYGITGSGNTGGLGGTFGTKRAIRNVFDATSDQFYPNASALGLGIDFDHPDQPDLNVFGDATPLDRESFPGLGDSGGGYWIEENGTWKIAAIQSWGLYRGFAPNFGGYSDVAISMQVAPALPWIQTISGVPEPASAWLLALLACVPRRASALIPARH